MLSGSTSIRCMGAGRSCCAASTGASGAAVTVHDCARAEQRVGHGHAEPSREMVVAGASLRERRADRRSPERPHLLRRRDQRERLPRVRDVVACEPVEAMPAPPVDGDEARIHEVRQMLAGRRCRDPGASAELAPGPRRAFVECREDRRAGTVPDRGRDPGDVDVGRHGQIVRRRHFGLSRTVRSPRAAGSNA